MQGCEDNSRERGKTVTGPKMEDGGFEKSKNSSISLDLLFNIFYETKGSTF